MTILQTKLVEHEEFLLNKDGCLCNSIGTHLFLCSEKFINNTFKNGFECVRMNTSKGNRQMHQLQKIIEKNYKCRSYSGRGMAGRNCLGVEVSALYELGELIADIISETDDSNKEEVSEGCRGLKFDSLGYDTIIYFPGIPYEDEDEDENE